MSLLTLEGVSKRYRRGRRSYLALRDISLSLRSRELVIVLGVRGSGRSTLLRVAAGIERPDEGRVLFRGVPVGSARGVLGRDLAYCHACFAAAEGQLVREHVAAGLLARGYAPREALRLADGALARVGAHACADMPPVELTREESVLVSIARALTSSPAVLIADEPTAGVDDVRRDGILRLLRSIADEDVAVLMSTEDATCVAGADRALHLLDGELRTAPEPPPGVVVPLHLPARSRADKRGTGV